ncbi:MAG TPA: PAS domain S-box protein [Mesotoga infera]|jgi:PAS domain S-box-containing protein/putative nucleotidyltransferase with HDIG domain|nr:PAS domain S-box protein [Mesotoga sp.]NLI05735.1 PAS domain S-box protein [Thermotogaceae bacterium]HNS67030.1 PAS domain S-box protein [Mesotoga infera]HOI35220.1 PAS domain S-box protein [Mesotoga infera]HON29244.1 PAS domain S-box protein [Mesotoga infera]
MKSFADLTNYIVDMVFVSDMQAKILYVNDAVINTYGFSREDLLGKSILTIQNEISEEFFKEFWSKAAIGTSRTIESLHYRKNGDSLPVEIHSILIEDDGERLVVSTVRDITRRKRDEMLLKEKNLQLQALVNAPTESLFQIDPSGRVITANQTLCKRLGTDLESLIGKNIYDFVPRELAQARKIHAEEVLKTGKPRVIEDRREGIVLKTTIYPVFGQDGRVESLVLFAEDITVSKKAEEELKESESRVRKKLKTILDPESEIEDLELEDIFDFEAIQSMMNDFYRLTNIGMAIIDIHGKILVATGWQEICTKYHRMNPETLRNCLHSDLELSKGIEPGTFKLYKCANNMWDMATPIIVGDSHLGNLFLGQFFIEDESLDYELFRRQARKYGFNEDEYIKALDKVPVWSRETIDTVMTFYSKFAKMVSTLSFANIKLARTLSERDSLLQTVEKKESKFRRYVESAPDGIFVSDERGNFTDVNEASSRITGYTREELLNMNLLKLIHPESLDDAKEHFRKTVETGEAEGIVSFVKKTGEKGYWNVRAVRLDDTSFIGFVSDVTDLLMSQEALRKSEEEKSLILNATKESIVYYDRDLRINWINRAMSKRLGVEVGDLIGKKCFMIWKAGEKCDDCILEKVIKSREQKKTELTNEMGEYWLVRAYPVIGPDGDVTGVVEVSEDITERKRASKKLEAAFDALVRIASDIVSAKDPYTAGHQKNVSDLAVAIGKKMGLNYETLTCLKFAGLLHDIGKISIPSEILTRPVKLSNIELSLIKEHSRNGYNILKDIDLPWPIADIVLQHHERLDGSGYPNGLKNDEIRLESRIIAVADVVEAITSHRPYRQALGIEHALNEIKKNSGILYDPAVVEACVQVFEDGYLLTV